MDVIALLDDVLGCHQRASKGEYRYSSPFFPDRGRHLYVHPLRGYFCFRTSQGGSIEDLLSVLEIDGDSFSSRLPPPEEISSLKERILRLRFPSLLSSPSELSLPEWCSPAASSPPVYEYFRSRGITPEVIEECCLQGGRDLRGSLRVVIPTFDSLGRLEYYVSRLVDGHGPRYLNPPLRRGSQVGFLHRAIRASPSSLVLCEGPFSALGAGPDAVATFGKYVTSEQVSRIRNAGVSQVILSVERDAVQDAILAAKECLSLCLRVFLLFLPRGKDPDDLPHEYYVSLKNSAPEVTYPDLEKLRLRLS